MSDPLRVAILGFGWVTRNFHIPMIAAVPGLSVEVLGTARIEAVKGEKPRARVASLEEAATAPDVDVVVVATVNDLHVCLTELALRAGKHVVVEKPFTPTLKEARHLVELAKATRRSVTVFQNRRWDSDFLTVREAIENGVVGEVVHFESSIDRFIPQVKAAWREEPGPAAGTWFDLAPHLADQALLLFGTPQSVSVHLAAQRVGARTDDWFHAVLDYGRRQVILHASQLAKGASPRFRVHGTDGTLVKRAADPQEEQLLRGMRPTDAGFGLDPDNALLYAASSAQPQSRAAARGDQSQFYVQLERAIRGKGAYPVTHDEALAVMSILEAGIRSAAEQLAVVPEGIH
jgi:predicted dehydrogenase